MAEKKTAASKKTTAKKNVKTASKNTPAKKVQEVKKTKKPVAKKTTTKKEVKKEIIKEEKAVDTFAPKIKKEKKNSKIKTWFNKLTLEQIIIGGVTVIAILLIILICVSSRNTKTKNGDDIVVKVNGKTITANELYTELKKQDGKNVAINLVDNYLLDKEYKTTDDMKKSAKSTIDSYKSTYGENYEAFLQYNGIKNDKELSNLLIRNSKLIKVTEKYIKDNLTEKEMKDYYENSIYGDISAKHILISFNYKDGATDEEKQEAEKNAKAKAEEIIEKIKNGEDFSSLAKEYSEDTGSKENGGDLGYFNTGDMVEEFEKAAYALDVNSYTTEPVKTTYGYHIIMKTGAKEKPSYEKAKDTVIEKLIAKKKTEDSAISVKAMDNLRKKYKMTIKDKTVKKDYDSYIKESTKTTNAQ